MLPHPLPAARSLNTPHSVCHPICPVSLACPSRDHAGRPRVPSVHRCPSLSPSSFPTSPQGLLPLPSRPLIIKMYPDEYLVQCNACLPACEPCKCPLVINHLSIILPLTEFLSAWRHKGLWYQSSSES